jgi:hypothetical protein
LATIPFHSPAVLLAPIIELRERLAKSPIFAGVPNPQDEDCCLGHLIQDFVMAYDQSAHFTRPMALDWSSDPRMIDQLLRGRPKCPNGR